MNWPPDYTDEFIRRQKLFKSISSDPVLLLGALEHYEHNPIDFINDWCLTYDPRNAGTDKPTTMPFCLFKRQRELVEFVYSCIDDGENGLLEKCRDMGASWVCCGISLHLFIFYTGAAIGWGSRKEELVDRIGDMKALFPKIRFMIEGLPWFFMPGEFSDKKHMPFMKVINPETGSSITGESGDNIGRGGRTLVYFKDESAHYERPDKVEAALADNTNVQIDISSVNGIGNVFYRRRMAGEIWEHGKKINPGITRIFIMDWRDHPHKTQEWYDKRRDRAEREGLSHVFSQEVDRDYAASRPNTIIKGKWIKAVIDAHLKLGFGDDGAKVSALDVADGGEDKNAWGFRSGIVLKHIEDWGDIDTTETAEKAVGLCYEYKVDDLQYDSIGVGAGVKGETNRLKKEGRVRASLKITPWAASGTVLNPNEPVNPKDPDSKKNIDFFENLKAQAYWRVAIAAYKTYRAVEFGDKYDENELISIDSTIANRHQLEKELCQPERGQTTKGKMIINKKPAGTKSPNFADCVVMMYSPVIKSRVIIG